MTPLDAVVIGCRVVLLKSLSKGAGSDPHPILHSAYAVKASDVPDQNNTLTGISVAGYVNIDPSDTDPTKAFLAFEDRAGSDRVGVLENH